MTTNIAAPSLPEVQVTPERIMQFAWGYAITLVMEAAIRHRVFDALDHGPMNIDNLQLATGASRRGLAAIVNVLVGLNFVARDLHGNYSLTPESSAFLVSAKPGFMGGIIRHTSEHLLPSWLKLNEVVASGKPVHSVNQEQQGGEFFHEFVADIFPMSYPPAQALALHLDLASAGPASVLDLAAGSGVWSIALAQSAQQVRVNADRTGPLPSLIFAVNMLVNTDEGDTFSFEEISSWLTEAGFVDPRTLASPGPSPLILATKP